MAIKLGYLKMYYGSYQILSNYPATSLSLPYLGCMTISLMPIVCSSPESSFLTSSPPTTYGCLWVITIHIGNKFPGHY